MAAARRQIVLPRRIAAVVFAFVSSMGTAAEPAAPCSQLPERECLESTRCDVVQVAPHGKYECREAAGRCAVGFRQGGKGDIKQECEAKPGCVFNSASCYCPPDLLCTCGGGPPAQCVEQGEAPQK